MTEHFSLEELTRTDHRIFDNTPDAAALANLHRLAEFLERVRAILGNRVVIITSGYRSKAVNDAVGSKDTSQHRLGLAADFRVPGMSPQEVVSAIVKSGIAYDQVIKEYNSWTHVSIANVQHDCRREALIIDKTGTIYFA